MKKGHFVQIFGGKTGIFQQNPPHKGRNSSGVPPLPPPAPFCLFFPPKFTLWRHPGGPEPGWEAALGAETQRNEHKKP